MVACVSGPAIVASAVALVAVLSVGVGYLIGHGIRAVEEQHEDEILSDVLEFAAGEEESPDRKLS